MEERSDCDAVLLFLYCSILCAAILLLFFIILCICCCKKKKTEVKEEGIEVPPLPVKPVQDQERNASESEEADVSNPFHRDEEWTMSDDASSIGKSEQDDSESTGALNPFSQEVSPGLTLARAPETVEASPEPRQDVEADVEERPTPLMPSLSLAGFGAMTGTSATVEYPLPPPLPAKPVRQSSSSSEEGMSRALPKPVLGQSMELSSPIQESSPLSPQRSAEPLQLPPPRSAEPLLLPPSRSAEPLQLPPSRSTEPPQPSSEPPRRSIQPPPRSVKPPQLPPPRASHPPELPPSRSVEPPQLPPPRRTVRPPTRVSSSEDDSDDFMPTPPRRSVQPPPRTVDTPFGPVSIARPPDASFPSSSPPRRSVQPPSLEPARPTRTVRPPPTAQPDVTLAHPTRSAPTPSASDRLSSRYSKPLPSLPPKPSRSVLPPSTSVATSPSTAISRNASSPTLLFSVPEDIAFPTTTVTSPELQQLSNVELEEEKSFMRQLSHPNILRVGEHEAAES